MRASVRKTISVIAIAALAVLLACLLSKSKADRLQLTCEGMKLEYADKYRFVTENDIKGYLDRYYGSYIGQRLDSVDLCKVENILDDQSAILKSEAYTSEDGILNIQITQREPVLRFQGESNGFYVDERGFIFPLQGNFTSHVPIIDGTIPVKCPPGYKGKPQSEEEQSWIDGVMNLINYINKNKTWRDMFVQYHVNPKGDLTLVPREGDEKFIIGKPEGFGAKFGRIARYYEYIKPAMDSTCYSTVNVKYEGQIICKK